MEHRKQKAFQISKGKLLFNTWFITSDNYGHTYAILVVDELTEFTYVIIINIDRMDKTCVKNKIGGNPVTQQMKTGQRSSLRCGESGREVKAAG